MRYRNKVIILLIVLAFIGWRSEIVFCKQPSIYKLQDLSSHGRYEELVRSYSQMSEKDKAKGETLYLVGYALLRIRRIDEAKSYLQSAIKKGFNGYPAWTSARSLLQKIKLAQSLRPPFIAEIRDEASQVKMRAFGIHTEWINYAVSALPVYLSRAETVLGKDIPPVDFYFFADRQEYNEFFNAMFDGHKPRQFQDGTADLSMVVFCQIGDSGKIDIPAGSNRALGNILHEYGHALCHTIYGDNYLFNAPEWLNEGFADYLAEPYFAEQYKSYDQRLIEFAQKHSAPTYKQMSKELYKDPNIRYAIGAMMVRELVADKGPDLVLNLMNSARRLRDFNKAIVDVAGYRPEILLQRVVRKYWLKAK